MSSSVKSFLQKHSHPAQLIVSSFALVILFGTILISLPAATVSGERLSAVDAFFTIVSATCVTGLAVADTGGTFSLFGQLVILTCIQIGGLGLMTFTTIFLMSFGYRLPITDRIAIQESFHHTPSGKIWTLIKYIFIATFTVEAIGAASLTIYWMATERFATLGETIYNAAFHSISSFCNAGFSLFSDSMMGFQADRFVQVVTSLLILAGGLGFLAGLDIKEYVQQKYFYRFWSKEVRERVELIRPRPRLSVHTKFVIITNLALLAIGTVSFYFLEREGVFANLSMADAWMNAYFCAVTPRTAGFNNIDYTQMGGAALLCTMVLMFIGASPGSTGGGIKTTTFGLLVAYSLARWRGSTRLHVFNRTIPQESIDKAASVVVAAIALLIITSSVLMVTETRGFTPGQSQDRMVSIIFEAISAFATVGLSLNFTPLMTDAGKLVIAIVMFMGRVGPLTLALAISLRQKRVQHRFAEENIMVG